MAAILIIEDDQRIRERLTRALADRGHAADARHTGFDGLSAVVEVKPDVVVLDLGLPDVDGADLLRMIRGVSAVPIVIATARTEESAIVELLDAGADDYVTKPFSPKTLVARVKALFRRVDRSQQEQPSIYRYGSLSMDLPRHEVSIQDKDVSLTAKEFGLLEHLLRNQGRVLTREVLLNHVWGYDYFGTTRTVDVHIRRLKQKLPLLDDAIVSVKSLGYKLKDRMGTTS